MPDVENMTESQQAAYLAATVRIKRIEQGIDPDTGERRADWNVVSDLAIKEGEETQ